MTLLTGVASQGRAPHQMENLGRGVVAVRQSETQVYVGWRLLGADPPEIAFNLYRSTGGGAAVRLNDAPLATTTDFVDRIADSGQTQSYFVRPVINGEERAASAAFNLPAGAPARQFIEVPLQTLPGNTPNDASVGDLDGDGESEIVLKQEMSPRDNSQQSIAAHLHDDHSGDESDVHADARPPIPAGDCVAERELQPAAASGLLSGRRDERAAFAKHLHRTVAHDSEAPADPTRSWAAQD